MHTSNVLCTFYTRGLRGAESVQSALHGGFSSGIVLRCLSQLRFWELGLNVRVLSVFRIDIFINVLIYV